MAQPLSQKKCVACEGFEKPLGLEQIADYMRQIDGWHVLDNKKVRKDFKFKNFKEAMDFVNKVAEIAEQEQHHPDIYIFYNKVQIGLFTHAISGLSENDFILSRQN